MSVHYQTKAKKRPEYKGASFAEVKNYLANQETTAAAPLAEIVATDDKGRKVLAEAVTEVQRAHEAEVTKAKIDADRLRKASLELGALMNLKWPAQIPASRFKALSWGTVVNKMIRTIQWAPHDKEAYKEAYQYLTGHETHRYG